MPESNAIISTAFSLEPPLDRAPADMLVAEGGLSVVLEDGRRVRLDPADPRSAGFANVLDGLSKQGLPVYLEIEPSTSTIVRLLIPQISRVVGVHPGSEDTVDVELELSHARHVLQPDQPESADLESKLRDALQSGKPIILTEDDSHRIVDVRAFTPDPDRPLPPFPSPYPRPRPLWSFNWIWDILRRIWWWLWCWFRCPSITRAQQVFDAMNATSCDPLTVPVPCIPFLYPDDGCWARAHEMCRLMINMGLAPRKVWIRASANTWLHVNTRNNPACYVEWGWHVAPTLCVRGASFFQVHQVVIDPSLFSTPVSEPIWKGVQGDPNATLTDTDATQYWPSGGTDPSYIDTNYRLSYYRLQLQSRAIQAGPPPYANCP